MEQLQNNQKKRIAMFSIHSDPLAALGSQETGGQNIYIKYLMEELDRLGYSVDVFTRWDSGHKKQIANVGKRSRVIRLKGNGFNYVPKTELFALLPEIFNSFLVFCDFQNQYDIFHGHYWDGGWMALEASKKFQKPYVENFHSLGQIRMKTKEKYKKNGKEDEYFNKRFLLEKEIAAKAANIISLSESEKESLIELYDCPKEKIKVIPGAVNLKHWPLLGREKARNYLGLSSRDFIILFVGRLEWRKGVGTLIPTTQMLKNEIPNLKTIVVGGQIFGKRKNTFDVKEYNRLTDKAKEAGICDIMSFRGKINNQNLLSFYQAADVFVVPSYYEPFGLVALEAMANKTPVIVSKVDGLSTIIRDGINGLTFEPRNPVDLKNKILQIYESKEMAKKLTENAYKDVCDNYSWTKIAKMISEIYEDITKKL